MNDCLDSIAVIKENDQLMIVQGEDIVYLLVDDVPELLEQIGRALIA